MLSFTIINFLDEWVQESRFWFSLRGYCVPCEPRWAQTDYSSSYCWNIVFLGGMLTEYEPWNTNLNNKSHVSQHYVAHTIYRSCIPILYQGQSDNLIITLQLRPWSYSEYIHVLNLCKWDNFKVNNVFVALAKWFFDGMWAEISVDVLVTQLWLTVPNQLRGKNI